MAICQYVLVNFLCNGNCFLYLEPVVAVKSFVAHLSDGDMMNDAKK